jgi:transcriptional regulator with XRE-family HTH domain
LSSYQELPVAHIHMTSEELSAARKAFGLSGAEFARVFDVSERTVRGWEAGRRDRNSEPVVIPRPIAVLVRLALKHASVRRELGIPSEGRAVKATSSIASEP